jgi:hypothetical protein
MSERPAVERAVEEWAQKMAKMCEPEHEAGWGIYADWLRCFLSAVRIAESGVVPWTEENVRQWCAVNGVPR